MNTRISIKNFRAFDRNGASFELRPLTILTGCNSSGKISLAKSLILLNDFLREVVSDTNTPRLDFGKKPLSLLGNFETVLNKQAIQEGVSTMFISYEVESPLIGRPLTVSFEFGMGENDLQKNGFLKSFSLSDQNGRVLLKGNNVRIIQFFLHPEKLKRNALSIRFQLCIGTNLSDYKRDFFAFCRTHLALHAANVIYSGFTLDDAMTTEEDIKQMREIHGHLKDTRDVYGRDHVLSIIKYYSENLSGNARNTLKVEAVPELIEKAAQTNIVAYLPILTHLDSIGKEAFPAAFRMMCKDAYERKVAHGSLDDSRLEAIIQGYQNSSFALFSDYYRDLENDYLDNRFAGNTISDMEDAVLSPVEGLSDSFAKETPKESSDKVTFEKVFRFLCDLNPDAPGVHISSEAYVPEVFYYHDCIHDFTKFRTTLIQDAISEDICQSLAYVSSSRIDVQRLYSVDNNDNFSHALIEYLEARRVYSPRKEYVPGSFINKWIKEFEIGDRFEVQPIENGLGFVLKVYQSPEDNEGTLLADYGYGISQLISILIEIETSILKSQTFYKGNSVVNKETGKINLERMFDVGIETTIPRTIVIEEPEIHQHPSFQSKLAEMFVDAMNCHNVQFILETHSEYLVRRIQTLVAKQDSPLSKEDVSIIYVNNRVQEGEKKVRQIEIADDGRLKEPFGPGFFDEADSLAMNLLMIKGGLV